ncbi:hypothetical protein KIW84_064162 [Lathyrus oleraceus]|uniref:Agenet domain-containing protein n=1 Tax=Pisum sativum TaxID=3888 RepID=A0A9D4WBH0_PEA|nr:hypothetical protein KIW84_064162 [Pisum sativum]
MEDEEGTKDLQETAKISQLRPIPPNEIIQDFQVGDEVDAYDNNRWWEVRISESFGGGMWAVYFKGWSEKKAYSDEELRWHHKWVNGIWITQFPQHVCNDGGGFKVGWKFIVQYANLLDDDDYKHLKEEINLFQIRLGLMMFLISLSEPEPHNPSASLLISTKVSSLKMVNTAEEERVVGFDTIDYRVRASQTMIAEMVKEKVVK